MEERHRRQRDERNQPREGEDRAAMNARHEREDATANAESDRVYANDGFVRPTYGNLPRLAQIESKWIINRLIESNRANGRLLAAGIALGAIASVWAVFL